MKICFAILVLAALCTGCKFGNVERGDLPLVPIWHQSSYPNYKQANAYEREMGYFKVDDTMPDDWELK